MAMMKMVDMAMIKAVARCPWPDSSAEVGERRQGFRTQASLQGPIHQAGPFLLQDQGPCKQWLCHWDTSRGPSEPKMLA